ncbi:protein strawberry notch isoform X2 [Phlebotomus papatasi]|uniref:protein strawberry notch isoform X2 n=1 Tax=Phlebotomus papatasi TaxID=29031 RepID=UPI00248355DC|nr:protein strawberry notch isoform X2 [Phlebotomus papatasi]
MYKMASKTKAYTFDDDEDIDESSGSDFDDDEDPDKIEVPGGGKDLETAVIYAKNSQKGQNENATVTSQSNVASAGGTKIKTESKVGGSKGGSTLGYDSLKQNAPGMPFAMGSSGMMGGMGLGGMSGYYPGSSMAASLLAQSKSQSTNKMEMAGFGFGGMGVGASASGTNPMSNLNQFMLQNLSNLIAANPSFLTGGIPTKLLSQMWTPDPSKQMNQVPEEEEAEDEEMGVAETYADYMPAKLKLGKKHPDPVVETASLSSVEPADVSYKLSIPEDVIEGGLLSALQLESITYASQAHAHILPDGSRAGFLIGDGAGVGKGRTIAGIIFENYLKGRKRSLWISVSNDLKYDAIRDLKDIGAHRIDVHALNKFKYAKISSSVNNNVKKGVIFSTYSALIGESQSTGGKYKSRLKQLLHWCGEDFDGVIVFDECHKAKNLCPVGSSKPTKTGLTALELQNKLPKARVVYASATGASEPRNMAYMVRLGIWGAGTPFASFNDFITAVEKRGVGAMEVVAMDMKLRGMYIARQLSFHGVSFKIEEVALSDEFKKVYDQSVELWVEAMQKFTEAAELIDAESRMKKTMWGQFWSAHQRFFKYLCIASKVNHAVVVAREAIKYGKCVVIGLQSTGEARTLEQLERDDGELSDFVSTAKGVFQSLVEKHFPAPDRSRIQRLLGIEAPPKRTTLQMIMEEEPQTSTASVTNKRKSSRQAAQKSKRSRKNSSDASDSDADASDDSFKVSGSESEESEPQSDDYQSSDFNPFESDSDSDADPWVGRQKKTKKKAPKGSPKKKPVTTQDKIQQLLTKKQTEQTPVIHTNGMKIHGGPPPKDAIERACTMKDELLEKIERLGEDLPPNTLDQLIDELGGPENVAEMTGRKGRVVQTEDGQIQYESRSEQDVPLETLNLTEKGRFMNGEKDVAIISEAASSGISLQSDRRVRNQRRRVHITLELPWSADRAIQQFGRTHRSNQVNAPEYIFLISDLAGERRFASTVAKRLESLGALTHGDRRATETRDLSQFNIDNKYGRSALEAVMKTIMGYEQPVVPPPADYKGDFFKDIAGALVGVGLIVNSEAMPGILSLDKDYNNISKFLNRILGMPVELQNRLFKYFTDTLAAIITQAKKLGRFDLGILDLGAAGENVTRIKLTKFIRRHATGVAPTELHTVHVERGMIWQEAIDKWADLASEKEGFYLSHQTRNGKQTAILVCFVETAGVKKKKDEKKKKDILCQIYRPNTGLQFRQESLAEIEKKYKKASSEEAEQHWMQQYDASVNTCSHAYWRGNCRNVSMGQDCEVGLRRRTYTVLAGSVLTVWSRVEHVLTSRSGANNKMQVIRMKTKEGQKIVGTLIPKNCVDILVEDLKRDAEKVEEQSFQN